MRLYEHLIVEHSKEIERLRQAYQALKAVEAEVEEYNRRWRSADIDTQERMELDEFGALDERITAARNIFEIMLSELSHEVRMAYWNTPFVKVREQGEQAFWRKALPELEGW